MDWAALIQFVVGAGFFTSALAFIGKKVVESFFNFRAELHRAELQRNADLHRAELERIATERSIRFQSLQTERAEVIKDCYTKLGALNDALESVLRPFQHVSEPSEG